MATGKKLSGLTTIESLEDDDLIYVVRPSEWSGERSKGITKQDFLDGLGGSPEETAVLSTGETIGYVLQADGDGTSSWVALAGGGNALTSNPLSQFAATTKAQLDGVISDGTPTYVGDAPTAHTHTASEVTDFDTEVSNNASVVANTAKNTYPSADATKVGYLTVTQAVDLDTLESDVATNNAKISFDSTSSTRLANTSGTNTGDQDISGIATNASAISGKQATLVSGTNIKTINGSTVLGSGDLTVSAGDIEGTDVLSTGETGGSKFLREDGDGTCSWQAIGGGGDMLAANNLSDLTNTTTARTNLGVDAAGTDNSTDVTLAGTGTYISIAGQVITVDPITESDISDLGTYSTDIHANITALDNVSGTNTGDQTSIVGITGTKAQFNTAVTDGTPLYVGDVTGVTTEISNLVEDTTPQLGGNLDLNGNVITGLQIGTDVQAYSTVLQNTTASFLTADETKLDGIETGAEVNDTVCISFAISDETTDLTTGTTKATFRMPFALTLTDVRASVSTAPTGSTLIVDINETATTILSTKLSIDAGEKTSATAASAVVISDTALADDAEITFDIDQVGSTVAGAGLKIYLIGNR